MNNIIKTYVTQSCRDDSLSSDSPSPTITPTVTGTRGRGRGGTTCGRGRGTADGTSAPDTDSFLPPVSRTWEKDEEPQCFLHK